ncbi:methionine gamma-lyase, putative [Entamoeba histolytica HM-1:IMSS-B]|uniref:Methionine gamma-lyase n=5 Tax=Entamoeba histolytica TaxID=5759 RepID=A0A8U0WPT3_ENTH1|nr:methionine gamma-lyase [Entamoeba histolytica HM-1:IMSS]EMH77862.1 methionine gamma-lyase, putative [Entamoeba histolytica HM-1:IMSS-B]EMS12154.1 methionine gamma-lyase 2, putative [Entamoeba histolytica HM-3:IMSS]ENY63425.1 methionine gamma-lyase 2, putative [Entamoeba histolytica HM-1:IMSS-A]BAC75878.2 methionine gamma-lyase 2 [Entamoeba histolytica]EAL43420.1 methionine gamma-lyase [Entamoeba histolytica HM-1:IMSS]|eukprot:XP_648806.1 methionine gamma-lyase [Entamoeba histolytica HM-1:IMSS]
MSQLKDLQTRVLHTPSKWGEPLHAHTFPIFQTSTYLFDDTQMGADLFGGKREGHMYSRMGNPTVEYFEELVNSLEGGVGTAAFGSGMGAIHSATMGLLKAGDHLISGDTLYGCTVELFGNRFKDMGVDVSFVNTASDEAVVKAWKPNTKMVYLESPANPTCKVSDIKGIAKICHEKGAILVVDCTFTTPVFLPALELGADVVLHSITKYINGHGDVVGGVVTTKNPELLQKIKAFRKDTGSLMAPMDAFLCIRGVKTLPMRMKVHMENGLKVAKFLEQHPKIKQVNHPGLESFPGHKIAMEQMKGFGSTFSFEMKSFEAAKKLMEHVKLCGLAVSLGTLDTLIEHPASMTHAAVPEHLLKQQGLTRELVRISVGLENPDDIIADLKQALEQC